MGGTVGTNQEVNIAPFAISIVSEKVISLRTNKWKFIYLALDGKERVELYDLENDRRELRNLADQKPQMVARFKQQLFDSKRSLEEFRFPSKRIELDEQAKQRLRSLGYLK
jgi:arylsulfatase A-like enzyme